MTGDAAKPTPRAEAASTQSKNALKAAEAAGLLLYRLPVEVRVEGSLARLRSELGGNVEEIDDAAVYYWVYVPLKEPIPGPDGTKQTHQAILIPEGEVRPFVLALAAAAGIAPQFSYRKGVVPR